jgi:hypothetical protein
MKLLKYILISLKIKGVYMNVNTSYQTPSQLPDSKTFHSSVSEKNFLGRKVEHIPKDNIKSGSLDDKNHAAQLFLIPIAIILGIFGMIEFAATGGKSAACFIAIFGLFASLS